MIHFRSFTSYKVAPYKAEVPHERQNWRWYRIFFYIDAFLSMHKDIFYHFFPKCSDIFSKFKMAATFHKNENNGEPVHIFVNVEEAKW